MTSLSYKTVDLPSFEKLKQYFVKNEFDLFKVYKEGETSGKNVCVLTESFPKMANRIRNFEVKKDDAWVLTYPKCGK